MYILCWAFSLLKLPYFEFSVNSTADDRCALEVVMTAASLFSPEAGSKAKFSLCGTFLGCTLRLDALKRPGKEAGLGGGHGWALMQSQPRPKATLWTL